MGRLMNFMRRKENGYGRLKGMRNLYGFSDNKGISELGQVTAERNVLVQGVWYEVLYRSRNQSEKGKV